MLRVTLLVALFPFMLFRVESKFQFQKPGLGQSALAASRAEVVKHKFQQAYADYIRWGFPADEVAPLSKNGSNTRNGWGATLVDSLDTLFMMGLHDEFEHGLTQTAKIDFSRSYVNETVSVFETTIRYLGGILTAYELSGFTRKDLLDRAYQLGNKLAYAWSHPIQQIPYGRLNFTTNTPTIDTNSVAGAGTLILEFDRLSHYTGNDTFRALADKSMKAIMTFPDEFPGLPSLEIYPGNASVAGDYITWGGGIELGNQSLFVLPSTTCRLTVTHSYFEYLLKYAMLTNNRDPRYLEACFVGGNWLLGGKLIGDETVVNYGIQLIDTCMHTYTSTETGLGPEILHFLGPKGEVTGPNMTAEILPAYRFRFLVCRPEVIESVFYAWRMTGKERYQEFAWSAFQALNKYCKASASYAAIMNVNDARNVTQINRSESFFYAETFKYLYLIFAPAYHFSLDEYVFNTEAHPYRYTYG
ncbi:family 47 glycoside hydrolase [Melampsora larici-populina 98AG31]|uniref:alpha-1,2-Mannosidase n=1 Tax=Melampsora larici-populina (strain 98AG31 / pathotype 3-4-7) TaxID=747676 RepID=F4RVI1_MELLP|nr:family 47 glycoside hydrolase [Melampsora larici-populina 98AG31]EGG03665.1 family 47 glycoside hydrolase [Melampsora larici-populina 98AG31]